ncbi:MAG: hypothetical protein GF405_10725 [Candidatus Eisenbacteria bacterium]|nr:hypothetical protein [Candidatus Eisenbacteria bacterium]
MSPLLPRAISVDRLVALVAGVLVVMGSGLLAVADVPLARSLAALLLITWSILRSLMERRPIGLPRFVLPSGLLVVLMIIGLVSTGAPLYGAWKIVLILVHWVMVPVAFILLARRQAVLESFVAGLATGGLMYGALLYATEGSPLALLTDADRFFRLSAGAQNPIYLGRVLGLSLLAIFWAMGTRIGVWLRFALLACVPPLLGYLAATASKGPILGFLAAAAAFGAAGGTVLGRTVAGVLVVALVLGLMLSYGALPTGSLAELRIVSTAALSVRQRVEGWASAATGYARSDFAEMLFGNGTGDFAHFERGIDIRHYPHNVFLEVLYENGAMGLALLVWFLLWPLVRLGRLPARASVGVPVRRLVPLGLGFFVFTVANAQVTGDVSTNELVPLSCAFVLAVTSLASLHEKTEGKVVPAAHLVQGGVSIGG